MNLRLKILATVIAVLAVTVLTIRYGFSSHSRPDRTPVVDTGELQRSIDQASQNIRSIEERISKLEQVAAKNSDRASAGPLAGPTEPRVSTGTAEVAAPEFGKDLQLIQELRSEKDPKARAALVRRLLQSPFPGTQLAGVLDLLKTDPEQGLQTVRSLLSNLDPKAKTGSWGLAEAAILSLQDVKNPRADTELYRYYESGERMLKIPAARALELRGDSRPIEQMVRDLSVGLQSTSPSDRIQAVTDLGRTRSPASLAALSPALSDPDAEVRIRATQALSRVGGNAAVPLVRQMLDDNSSAVRETAERVLAELRDVPRSAQ